ncbi:MULTISPECIES: hypothetical protein [unclassified Streptomyces]|uniref:hypothetical protein n=1 Tax=unclassified Streptomyces TaxID=2593676 RepID=UPI0013682C26|nr:MULTISPECIES: hypothetical protein [unclassified Streptomyces]NEA05230.1 hypothetical protein [Streptomyces sp. SID10116]MYY82480.1 hypothetical protein [Streptomyces sp. SID335]MYZ18090.1 hypothetical protein [Streptomyces sp. SID337]NDZ91068.1 hypothetical protein [Streptomyces sp. SID10115]NEB45397.1 hypothetical protein [Streptomyces sp. SID339]
MSGTTFRSGVFGSYPLPNAGPDARPSESLLRSVAGVLVGYGYPPLASVEDWSALESALTAFLFPPKIPKEQ